MAILQRYGDLRGAKGMTEAIMASRPIRTTQQLKDAVIGCFQDNKTRKIAQVFQAFRIATNNEIKDIEKLCESLEQCLGKGGLFMGITFHSLERDVIHSFHRRHPKAFSKIEIEAPFPEELVANSKSRSAKMLSFRKLI
jgi:16S rRNA (cytosine1402-N4)-methyltransferase